MRRAAHRSITTLALAFVALGCPSLASYTCEDAPDCDLVMGGACESDGRCSYPDGECDSGRRYAGTDDVSGPCVPADGDASTSSSATSASTSSAHDSSGTTSSPPQCGNGIVEPGEACDELDDVDGDGCNVDCVESGTPLGGDSWDYEGGNDRGFGMAIAPDGRFAVVGFVTDGAGEQDSFVQMRTDDGTIAWTNVLPNVGTDSAEQVLFTADGGVIACGVMADPVSALPQGWIRRFDAGGAEVWSVVLTEPEGSWIKDCQPRDDGTFTIAGTSGDPEYDRRGLLGLFDPDGTRVWQRLHGDPALDYTDLTGATVGVDDLVVVGGRHDFGDGEFLAIVAAYSPSGDIVWEAEPGGTLQRVQECFSVGRALDAPFAVGRYLGDDGSQAWIGEYPDAELGRSTIELSPRTGSDEFHRIAAHPDGDLVVVGSKGGAGHDILVVRYAPDLDDRWLTDHAGDGGMDDKAWDVGFMPDGTILVAGYETTAEASTNVWLQRYAP